MPWRDRGIRDPEKRDSENDKTIVTDTERWNLPVANTKKTFGIRTVYLYLLVLSIWSSWEILVEESSLQDTMEDAESSNYVYVCYVIVDLNWWHLFEFTEFFRWEKSEDISVALHSFCSEWKETSMLSCVIYM